MKLAILFCVTLLILPTSSQTAECPASCEEYVEDYAEMSGMVQQIQDTLQARMAAAESANAELTKKIDRQERKIKKLQEKYKGMQKNREKEDEDEMPEDSELSCGMVFDGSCFAVINATERVAKDDHERLCEDYGGHLANVYSEEHLTKLNEYLNKEGLPSRFLWTGMTYSAEKGLLMYDGTKADFVQWSMSVFPARHWLWTAILLHVSDFRRNEILSRISPSVLKLMPKAGLRNIIPTSKFQYSLCEYPHKVN